MLNSRYLRPFLDKLLAHTLLAEQEQIAFVSLPGSKHEVKARTEFVHRGNSQNSTCFIVSGLCARIEQNMSGERQITNFYLAGEVGDLNGLMVPSATPALSAISAVEVFRVQHTYIRALTQSFPSLGEALWRHMVYDAEISAQWIANNGGRQAKSRLAHLFCEMAVRSGSASANSFEFHFPATQETLGEATGMSTVHVNRSIQALRHERLLQTRDGHVLVEDWATLQATAEFDGEYLNMQPQGHLGAFERSILTAI